MTSNVFDDIRTITGRSRLDNEQVEVTYGQLRSLLKEIDDYVHIKSLCSHKWFDPLCQIEGCKSLFLRSSQEENIRLRQWINDLHDGMWINCVYCGHRYGPSDTTPMSRAELLKQHVQGCPEHPMYTLKQEFDAMQVAVRAASAKLQSVIESTIEDLSCSQ